MVISRPPYSLIMEECTTSLQVRAVCTRGKAQLTPDVAMLYYIAKLGVIMRIMARESMLASPDEH